MMSERYRQWSAMCDEGSKLRIRWQALEYAALICERPELVDTTQWDDAEHIAPLLRRIIEQEKAHWDKVWEEKRRELFPEDHK